MKVIVITGASGGIGAATAAWFAEHGWEVVGTSRRRDAEWSLDVTSDSSVGTLVEAVTDRFGRIDALFNNAGFAQIGGFEEFDQYAHQAAFEVNVFGAMRLSAAVLPVMRRQGSGTLVHMGSVTSHLPAPFMGSYAATKHALEGFSKSLDHELRGSGLRSILVRAGFMRSGIAGNTVYPAGPAPAALTGRNAVHRSIDAALEKADDPRVVARAVHAVCSSAGGPSVVEAGREAKALSRLLAWLPRATFERAFRKQFGLAP